VALILSPRPQKREAKNSPKPGETCKSPAGRQRLDPKELQMPAPLLLSRLAFWRSGLALVFEVVDELRAVLAEQYLYVAIHVVVAPSPSGDRRFEAPH
jgi:hypothetical protein